MTRNEIIEAGARAIAGAAMSRRTWGPGYGELTGTTTCIVDPASAAAAMLDAITEGMGNKLMGRPEEFSQSNDEFLQDTQRAIFDWFVAAPWVPGGEK